MNDTALGAKSPNFAIKSIILDNFRYGTVVDIGEVPGVVMETKSEIEVTKQIKAIFLLRECHIHSYGVPQRVSYTVTVCLNLKS